MFVVGCVGLGVRRCVDLEVVRLVFVRGCLG